MNSPNVKAKNLLVLTDFSKSSTNAALYVAGLLKNNSPEIILLNTFESPAKKRKLLISVEDILRKDSETRIKKQMEQLSSEIKNKKIRLSACVEEGSLKNAINALANKYQFHLIAAGISSQKYPFKIPVLFIGQSRYPVLLVPELCSFKPVRDMVILNDRFLPGLDNVERIVNTIIPKDGVKKHTVNISKKNGDEKGISNLQNVLTKYETGMIFFISSPGGKTDKAMLEYRIRELGLPIASALSNQANNIFGIRS